MAVLVELGVALEPIVHSDDEVVARRQISIERHKLARNPTRPAFPVDHDHPRNRLVGIRWPVDVERYLAVAGPLGVRHRYPQGRVDSNGAVQLEPQRLDCSRDLLEDGVDLDTSGRNGANSDEGNQGHEQCMLEEVLGVITMG